MKHVALALILLFTCSMVQPTSAPATSGPIPVRWDLGDTLLKVDGTKCLKYFGYVNMPAYMAAYELSKGWNTVSSFWSEQEQKPSFKEHMKQLFLTNLSKIPSKFEAPDYEILGVNNEPVPPLQRDYLLGKLSGPQVMESIDIWIAANASKFTSGLQASIFRAQCDMYFNHYEEVNKYNPELIILFKLCHQATNSQGTRIYTNIICSNWPKHAAILKAQFPDIFEYSDMQLFSGEMGLAKPHVAFYTTIPQRVNAESSSLIATGEINSSNGFIVDDQQNNLTAASKYNVIGLDANDPKAVAAELGIDIT